MADDQEQATTQTEPTETVVQQPAASPEPAAVIVTKIPTANIKASKMFSQYNRDLMTVLLKEPSYTVEEAKRVLDEFMKKGVE